MRRSTMIGMAAAVMIGIGGMPTVFAAEGQSGPLRKLGRGVANIVTGPLELIRTPEMVGRRDGYYAALSVGLLEGVWRSFLRVAVGVFEVGTFFSGIPGDFEPAMRPEFVWAHGNWAE